MTPEILHSVFYDSAVPSSILDLDATIIDVNDAYCRLLNIPKKDLIGKKNWDAIPVLEPKVNLRTLSSTLSSWTRKRTYLKKDGTEVNIYFVASTLSGKNQILVQAHDITPYEVQLRRQQDELERFSSISSHDLREPLNTIAGLSSLLLKRLKDLDDESIEWLDTLVQIAKQMEKKLDDLLLFARAGRHTPTGDFPLGSAVTEAERALARKIKESNTTITVEGTLPDLHGDRSLIAQVLQNLFSNSIKYRRDGEAPRICIKAVPYKIDPRYWLISIEDNGLGFDMDFKDRIFEVFQRLYTLQKYPGTGIGLAIAKKIIERHNGRIWVQSAPNQGSTFFFTLPVPQ